MKKAPKIKGYKGGGDIYGTQVDPPSTKLTPQQWEAQNLKLGYLKAPGYSGDYGGYYNPKEYFVDDKGGFTRLSDKDNLNVNYNNDPTYKPIIQYQVPASVKSNMTTPKPVTALTSDRTAFDFAYQPQGYTGYKYNDGTVKYLNTKGEEMPKLNQGGLVKKYAMGGTTEQPDIAALLSQFAGQAGQAGVAGGGFSGPGAIGAATSIANTVSGEVDRNAMDEYGRYKNVNAAMGSNALKYGAQGASLGTMIAPGIGTGIGAGVGALAGAIYGNYRGKKDQGRISAEQAELERQKREQEMAAKRPMINSNIATALYSRGMENYAKGGKIVGPGTGKSDSIPAKVEVNSHVIPVENAPIAEEIRKKVLKAPSRKANLNQKGGVDVKLSNGEVVFSPEEKAVVEMELGEGVLDVLSPDADKDEYLGQKHQMAKGGPVNGIDPDKLRELKKSERLKQRQDLIKEYKELKAKAEAPGATEVSKHAYRTRLPEIERTVTAINKDYGIDPKTGSLSTSTSKGVSKAPSAKGSVKTAKITPQSEPTAMTPFSRNWAAGEDPNLIAPVSALPQNGMPANNTQPAIVETPLSKSAMEAEGYVPPKVDANGFNWNKAGDIASTALNYGIPLAQVYMGNKFLKDAGPRPIDQLDPDYLASIDKANAATALATKNAQFGFNPEELAALNQRNQNLTNAGVFAARNFSGGSGAGALANTRSALADAYGRDLQTQVQDRNLMLQKQDIAAERQRYANDLITRKAEMQRRLFGDTMTAFNQNQQSGADLLQAGLTNLVGANRYEQEKKAIDKRAQLAGSWMGTV